MGGWADGAARARAGRWVHACVGVRRLHIGWLLLVLAAAFLSACAKPTTQCTSSSDCSGDHACVDKVCRARRCISSESCGIGQYCDQITGGCVAGCLQDSDCKYGESCQGGACAAKLCRSTTLDCNVGEYCDQFTGTCYKAAGPYCKPCSSSSDCSGADSRCVYISGDGPFCAPACDEDHPCPAGYTCNPFTSSGEVTSYHCITLCQNLDELPP